MEDQAGHSGRSALRGQGGDAGRGAGVFAAILCGMSRAEGNGGPKVSGSIVDPSYLMLVSDQTLRTLIIAGRPDWAIRIGVTIRRDSL